MKTFACTVMVLMALHLGLVCPAQAFSVKDIVVQSRRGEPFRAEVRLGLEGQASNKDIAVSIGDQKAYKAEELLRPAALNNFKAVLVPGKRDIVRITSNVPIDTPKFDLLLLARSGQVTIVQHYPIKLAEAPLPKPEMQSVAKPLPAAPSGVPETKPIKAPKASTYPEVYGPVERGVTLYSIVRSLQVPNDKLWQTVIVLWRTNKQQFAAGNIHGLPAGAHLRIPDNLDEQSAALKTAEAQDLVSQQWEEWAALQRMGLSKRHIVLAAAAADRAAAEFAPQTIVANSAVASHSTNHEEPSPPASPPPASPSPAVTLPADQKVSRVSATELQTLLQGLEDRIMKRLTPTGATPSAGKGNVTFIDVAELQTTLQTFEERLTQRVQQMLLQGDTPVQLTTAPHTLSNSWNPPWEKPLAALGTSGSTTSAPASYGIMLGVVGILGFLSWLWFRRRGRLVSQERA